MISKQTLKKSTPTGYTLVEILTVVSIITVLMALFMPALQRARRFGRRVLSIHHQREIVRAVTLYACDSEGLLPQRALRRGRHHRKDFRD